MATGSLFSSLRGAGLGGPAAPVLGLLTVCSVVKTELATKIG